jgi:dUTP pyrophosphatase
MGPTVTTRFEAIGGNVVYHNGSTVMRMKIKKLHPEAALPEYAHGPMEDAGLDLRALEAARLEPGVPHLISTGLALEIPAGYEVQIRPRSGLALKHAITLPNAPATIDPGYRGELKVILLNLGKELYEVHAGDRIAQMIVARYEPVEWEETDLAESVRGIGGFGSSGR